MENCASLHCFAGARPQLFPAQRAAPSGGISEGDVMSRIAPVDPATTSGKTHDLLAGVRKSLGAIPNLYRVIAQSPASLEGVLSLTGALARGRLGPRLREQIALTVAEENGCDYCLSAHTALGRGLQISDAELASARLGRASDPRDDAALRFVQRVMERRGRVGDADLEEVRRAGFDDEQVVELVANAVLNVFTNYLNQVAETEIDFPVVRASAVKAA
jgi:uncharacterized peroxidase-related enzyme